MVITAFLPMFMLLLLYAMRGPRQWVVATGVACYLQGATPFLLAGGGRMVGVAPAYLLLVVGVMHDLRLRLQPSGPAEARQLSRVTSAPLLWLWGFTLVGVLGAMLLPRVFEGLAHAMPTRDSIDSGNFFLVEPTSTNIFQAFYLVLNLGLVIVVARLTALGAVDLRSVVRGLAWGAAISAALGLYQLVAHHAGLPWPREVINSNTGVGQFPEQMAGSIKRLTATFWEPAGLSFHFVGTIGLFLAGGLAWPLGLLVLVVQLLSTSSVGYVALALLAVVWLLASRAAPRHKLAMLLACVVAALACVAADLALSGGAVTREMILDKAGSSSGVNRGHANVLALRTFAESWGFGVGVGSARASSFVATLLATTGWLGMLTFGAFAFTLLRGLLRSPGPDARALAFGLSGFLIVWAIAIPDIGQALFWFVAGAAVGQLLRQDLQAAPSWAGSTA